MPIDNAVYITNMNKYVVQFYDYDFNETWKTILYGNSFIEAYEYFKNKFMISIHETGEAFTISEEY